MENKEDIIKAWLKRAKSNLARAKTGKLTEDILYEDLCFDLQQAAEKSLKALLIHYDIDFPKTHSISNLMTLLENNGVDIPDEIKMAESLTDYAVTTRYPGDWEPVNENEYTIAFSLSEKVFNWVMEKTAL